ncbi:Uncharacterised protein [Helicobacter mustelae]|nr:Uncharacterised protein [Helicobacter mustelae]
MSIVQTLKESLFSSMNHCQNLATNPAQKLQNLCFLYLDCLKRVFSCPPPWQLFSQSRYLGSLVLLGGLYV